MSAHPTAHLPSVGGIYVWELDLPHACELLKVTDVTWNGEEWWVTTERLHPETLVNTYYPARQAEQLNELGRFWEAVTPVRETRTPRPAMAEATD